MDNIFDEEELARKQAEADLDRKYEAEFDAHIAKEEGVVPKAYKDRHVMSVGKGINLNVPSTKTFLNEMGINFDDVYNQKRQLTKDEIDALYNKRKAELDTTIQDLYKRKFPNAVLDRGKLNAIRSIGYQGPHKTIGPNLSQYLDKNDYTNAAKEILLHTNKEKSGGIQKRRLNEAQMFLGPSWNDFVNNLSDLEKREIKSNIEKIKNTGTKQEIYKQHPWLLEVQSPRFKKLRKK